MTRFKFFGFLLPLAMAGGLVVGLGAAPAQAHCKGNHHDGVNCTHPDEDQFERHFVVELIEDGRDRAITTDDNCKGSSKRKRVTDAKFPPQRLPRRMHLDHASNRPGAPSLSDKY